VVGTVESKKQYGKGRRTYGKERLEWLGNCLMGGRYSREYNCQLLLRLNYSVENYGRGYPHLRCRYCYLVDYHTTAIVDSLFSCRC